MLLGVLASVLGSVSHANNAKAALLNCPQETRTIFECHTRSKHKLLVCSNGTQHEYRYIRAGKQANTIIVNNNAQLKTYAWNGSNEAIGFTTGEREYKVYANYSHKNSTTNIFDDNISGGVRVLKKGKQISAAICAGALTSVSFLDVQPTSDTNNSAVSPTQNTMP